MTKGNVVIVDDDPAVLASLVEMISVEGYQARGFDSAAGFLNTVKDIPRSCVVTDLRMPGLDGLALIRQLRSSGCSDWPVIVISGHADVPIAVSAMQAGAITVLEKPFPPCDLIAALAESLAALATPVVSPDISEARARYATLSAREREVLGHLVTGSSSKVTAQALGISPRTVDVFRANILRKMMVPNIAALATQVARGLG